ncbi:MAG TPA: ABC transporter permease [Jatrophihabitans sp.]|jgi:ABC-2 type transport system permease protein|uniref:ABC transporter permease n=1 Tax=Jatrophihabitans sp. TaxID=1932789 RepID=UPI002F1898E5
MTAAGTKLPERMTAGAGASDHPLQRINAPGSFFRGFGDTLREIWQYRELLGNLIRKELKVKYKDSVLGFVWSLLLPLVQLFVYWLVIGKFLGAGAIPAYGVYIFCGLAVWTLFSEILSTATTSIVFNSGLVKKVYFPRELFPLAATGAALVNFLFQLVILFGAVVIAGLNTGKWPDPSELPLPLLGLVVLVVFATALGLLLAAANVYLRDVQHLITVVLMLWFWITPIIYNVRRVSGELPSTLYTLYLMNPMAPVVFSFQAFFWPQGDGTEFEFDGNIYGRLGIMLLAGLVFLWLAQRIFAKAQGNFAQEL